MNRNQETRRISQDVSTSIIEARTDIAVILLCIDIRRNVLPVDQEAARWFLARNIPVMMVLTKADELSKNQRAGQILQWREWIRGEGDSLILGLFPVSSRTGDGISDLACPLRRILYGEETASGE